MVVAAGYGTDREVNYNAGVPPIIGLNQAPEIIVDDNYYAGGTAMIFPTYWMEVQTPDMGRARLSSPSSPNRRSLRSPVLACSVCISRGARGCGASEACPRKGSSMSRGRLIDVEIGMINAASHPGAPKRIRKIIVDWNGQ